MVDAGTAAAPAVARLLELGVARVVIGTESLPGAEAFRRLRSSCPDAPLVLSLDLRGGRLVSPDPALSGLDAAEALARFADAGAREAIVLDLARVGSGEGPDVTLLGELHAHFPDVELLAGGGCATPPTCARWPPPGRPVRSSPPPCTAAPSRPASYARSRCSTRAAATSTPVALSTPRQPGMPLTSIT